MKVTVHVAAETNNLKFAPHTSIEEVLRAVDAPLNSTVMRGSNVLDLEDEIVADDNLRVTPVAKEGA